MTPNKKIPSFCFESPWLRPFDLTTLLSQQITEEIGRNILNDLVTVQPMGRPQGNLFYFDYNYGPMEEPVVYDDGSWSMGNTFEGVIGIKSEIKQHTLI